MSYSEKSPITATIDIVAFSFDRKNSDLKIALWERSSDPFKGMLGLPGVIINGLTPDSNMEDAVSRAMGRLGSKKSISHIEQVGTVGNADRDPRGWSISTVYMVFAVDPIEADGVTWVSLKSLDSIEMPFDHKDLVGMALDRLGSKSSYTSLPLILLPKDHFTFKEFLSLYNVIMESSVKEITLRKRLEFLESIGKVVVGDPMTNTKGRPSKTYSHDGESHVFNRSILV